MVINNKLNKQEWYVKPVDIQIARDLVEKFHYAKSATNTRIYTHGLFNYTSDYCFGVAWWLPPTKNAAMVTFPEGDWKKVLSLTRLVLDPIVPSNGASFLLSRSRKLINNTNWECLVTYADTYRGHTGAIYRADNWEYLGLTKPNPVFVDKDGVIMGRKRAGKNLTRKELSELGFNLVGNFPKHKFRKLIICTH